MTKPVFNDDLDEIVRINPNLITYIYFPRLWLSEVIKVHYDKFHLLNDASYNLYLEGTEVQSAIKDDIEIIFKVLRKLLKFDAVFSGNFVYVSQQEFFKVSIEQNIPVIVLYKEGMLPIGKHETHGSISFRTKQFHGTKLFVYNNMIKEMLVAANIHGVYEDNTIVVGVPRLDKYLRSDDIRVTEPFSIVLFFFEPSQKADYLISDKSVHKSFIETGTKFISNFVRLALERSDVKLVIKTKNYGRTVNELNNILKSITNDNLPNNIQVTSTENAYSLIRRCNYVAGYASTTLLEGMLADKVILCPDFSSVLNSTDYDYFSHYSNVVNYIFDYSELEEIFKNNLGIIKPDDNTKQEILEKYLYSADGASAMRVYDGILGCIKESKLTNDI